MLHKKNCSNDPSNYRGISLVNSIAKIFTQIIYNRISTWCDNENILTEGQNGFRPGRSTTDNIFIMTAIIQNHLRLPGRSVLAAFIDFKGAFDSLDHRILFSKLYNRGLSFKLIRIVKLFYDCASTRIKCNGAKTNEIQITKGVLQGETLSPLLFNIFLSDLEVYLEKRGCKGVSLDGSTNITALTFADDLVVLGSSQVDLRTNLKILWDYCEENKLAVNTNKTKVVKFSKGHSPVKGKIFFGSEELEITSSVNYLGITISKSSLFNEMCHNALTKSKITSGKIYGILAASKANSWEMRLKLYESVVKNSLLYGASVWGLRHASNLEVAQTLFFKRLLHLPKNTPSYIVRLETGTRQITLNILKMGLWFLYRISSLQEFRYLKIALNRLVHLHNSVGNNPKYNWFSQLVKMVNCSDTQYCLTDLTDPNKLRKLIPIALKNLENKLLADDIDRALKSTFNPFFREMNWGSEEKSYLRISMPIKVTRVIAQIRTSSQTEARILHEKCFYRFDQSEICSICQQIRNEDWAHVILHCLPYQEFRNQYLSYLINEHDDDATNLKRIFEIDTRKHAFDVYKFITNAMQIRSFLLNE